MRESGTCTRSYKTPAAESFEGAAGFERSSGIAVEEDVGAGRE